MNHWLCIYLRSDDLTRKIKSKVTRCLDLSNIIIKSEKTLMSKLLKELSFAKTEDRKPTVRGVSFQMWSMRYGLCWLYKSTLVSTH